MMKPVQILQVPTFRDDATENSEGRAVTSPTNPSKRARIERKKTRFTTERHHSVEIEELLSLLDDEDKLLLMSSPFNDRDDVDDKQDLISSLLNNDYGVKVEEVDRASSVKSSTHGGGKQQSGQDFRVPTFRNDGDNQSMKSTSTNPSSPKKREDDPFLYFSNQQQRMVYLIGEDEDENNQGRHGSAEGRKTRISFEVHASVMMEELMLEMYGLDSGDNNDEDEDDMWLNGDFLLSFNDNKVEEALAAASDHHSRPSIIPL